MIQSIYLKPLFCTKLYLLFICFNLHYSASVLAVHRETVVSGLKRPWDITFISAKEALVNEKEGGLLRINLLNGNKRYITGLPTDLDNQVLQDPRDNAGLFGIALSPDYPKEPWIYLSYSAKGGNPGESTTKVIRAKLLGNHLSEIQTLFVATPYSKDRFHYGGGLIIGRDKKLYFTIGERYFNEIDQPPIPVAQDYSDKRGKIYRLNLDGSIPNDNPVFDASGIPGVYAVGIRAAQGLTSNPKTGKIWFSEHGARQGDELNMLESGKNYGWPIETSGSYRNNSFKPPTFENRIYQKPVYSWAQTVAPTGLSFYYGDEFPEWKGNLFVAGLSRGSLTRVTLNGETVIAVESLFVDRPIRLRSVKVSPDNKIYLLTDERDGSVLRVAP